jgi:hypothetical protein
LKEKRNRTTTRKPTTTTTTNICSMALEVPMNNI